MSTVLSVKTDNNDRLAAKRKSRNALFSTNWHIAEPYARSEPVTPERSPTSPVLPVSIPPASLRPKNANRLSFSKFRSSPAPPASAAADVPSISTSSSLPDELLDFVVPRVEELSQSIDLRLRMHFDRAHLLGEGRMSSVYLGAYQTAQSGVAKPQRWQLCAIKRINSDAEAQYSASVEAYTLSRLEKLRGAMGPHPHIVRLIGIRNESEGEISSASAIEAAYDRLPASIPIAPPLERTATFTEASLRKAASSTGQTSHQTQQTPCRPLLVYELCPKGTLASFIRRQPQKVGRVLWLRWARQVSSALACCHSARVLHGDVKTQNLLVRRVSSYSVYMLPISDTSLPRT